VLLALPATLEHAFAVRGVPVAQVASMPELCTAKSCVGLDVWGGKHVILAPRGGKADFAVVIVPTHADAARMARLFRANSALGLTVRRRSVLLYLLSSPRVARLRAAFAAAG